MKKALISTLVAAMVVAFGATAFAAATTVSGPAFSDIAGHEAEFDLTVMKALGVMTGDAGTTVVRPNDTITRAEVAKVLVTMAGRQAIAAGMAGVRPSFTDEVPTWAWGFVNCAQVMGLVGGYEDGTFKAGNPVTYAEVITMLVRSVGGHKEQVAPGFWPYNFLFHAIDFGFTGNVDMSFAGLPCPRGDVARLAFSTMQVEKLDKNGAPIGGAYLQDRVFTDIVEDYDLANNDLFLRSDTLGLADSIYIVGATNLEALMNLTATVVTNAAGAALVVGKTQTVSTFTGWLAGVDSSVATSYKLVFEDGTKIPLPHDPVRGGVLDVRTRRNGTVYDNHWILIKCDGVTAKPRIECTVTMDASGKAKYIVAVKFTGCPDCSGGGPGPGYVTSFTASTATTDTEIMFRRTTFPSHYVDCSFTIPATAKVTINGTPAGRDDLALWDVFWWARDDDSGDEAYEVRAIRNQVQGKIDSKWETTTSAGTTQYVKIQKDDGSKVTFVNMSQTDPMAGGYYKFALDKDGALAVQILAETVTPYVLVKGYTDYGTYTTVTVDVRGAEVTYRLDAGASAPVAGDCGKFGKLDVDSITGKVTDFTAYTLSGAFKVVALDAANKTMTLYDNSDYYFINDKDIVVYSKAGTYIGIQGLKVGDWMKTDGNKVIFQIIDDPV